MGQRVVPIVLGHLFAVRAKPDQVANLRAADAPPLEEFPSPQHGMFVEEPGHQAREFQQLLARPLYIPIQPSDLIILAVGVVVAVLRVSHLVAGL